jgi:WD40 repeat protein
MLRVLRKGWAAFVGATALVSTLALAEDAVGTSHAEIASLQQRLTDAGCYSGAIDGAASAALDAAVKACPDQRPILRIETGMHTAQIRFIGVDAACTRLATASDDKTVRLWSLPDGRLERTIRLPISAGDGGKIEAAALSPDGRWLAAGGWDASWEKTRTIGLSLVDLQTGAVRRFGAFESGIATMIATIVYSADGRRLAVGLGGNGGLHVLDSASGAEALADRDYGDGIYGLAFAPDGSLVAASLDGSLRRYGPDLRLAAKRAAPGGKDPISVAIDPTGRRVAVGYNDTSDVSILDATSLARLAEADTRDLTNGNLGSVAWSSDGATLVAGGQNAAPFEGEDYRLLRRFKRDGKRLGSYAPAALDTIMDVRRCGDGFVFAAADPAIGRLGSDGKATTLQRPRTADMRDKVGDAFALSADGATVRFGLGDGQAKPVVFDLLAASLSDAGSRPMGLAAPLIDGMPVSDWRNNQAPKFQGAPIALEPSEISRALAIRPDRQGFALGTEYRVRAFDTAGRERWSQPGPEVAFGVNFSGDGEILAVAYGDGTIRWLRRSDGKELLALFVEAPTRRWVTWTPTGYYMASPGGEDLIGWHVNRGWSQLADFFPASRFSARFNRPDIVQLVLKTRDEAAAVKQANETAKRKQDTTPIAAQLPPVATIVSPAEGDLVSGDAVEVEVEVRSPSGLPVDRVDALIDGRPVDARGLAPANGTTRTLTVPAPAHDFELAVVARSGELVGDAAKVRLRRLPPAKSEDALKPKLYVVAVGVSDYADADLRLAYANADARDFAAAMLKQEGGLYAKVEVRTLVDRDATRANVLDALDWLDQQVTSRDIGMLMMAGHGVTDEKGRYWFLPVDASPSRLGATAVSQDDIRRDMSAVAGKAIVFLDTCHANREVTTRGFGPASVDVASLVNDFAKTENGLITFAATQGAELSQESAAWRHGAFSLALIEGIGEGKADVLHKGEITVSGLDAYIAERVKTLTEGHQHPVMSRPNTIPDFAFALAK